MLIYKITNLINSKTYIGQTTTSLQERIYNYRKECKWSKNPRPVIFAMRKYGIENFTFEIVENDIPTKKLLDEKERYYINEVYKSLTTQGGYNVELGGNGIGKHSEETKRKISEAQCGELNHMFGKTGAANITSKKIIELTTGKVYGSASEGARELGLSFSHVCSVARGERGSTGGYVFRYLDEDNVPVKPVTIAKIKSLRIREKILPIYKHLV